MATSIATPFNAGQIYQHLYSDGNKINLASKAAKVHSRIILARHDLHRLPQSAQRLVSRLQSIKRQKKVQKLARAKELKRIEFWDTISRVIKIAGLVLTVGALAFGLMGSNYDYMSSQLVPAMVLLVNGAYEHYTNDRNRHLTQSEFHDRIHGLDNERAAIMVELQPYLEALDREPVRS